jgi:hypothetical protein
MTSIPPYALKQPPECGASLLKRIFSILFRQGEEKRTAEKGRREL